MVDELDDKCYQGKQEVIPGAGVNNQDNSRMETIINNSTLLPGSVASDDSPVADTSYLAVVVATSMLALLFISAALALLIYRYYTRTSGPVWIQSKLASIRGRYSNMNDKDRNVQDNFIIGFGNPLCDNTVTPEDKADGITVLGYRRLDENRKHEGVEGHSLHDKLMFPRDRLVYGSALGTGWFGKVYEADAYRIKAGWRRTKVVIKELQVDSDLRMKDLFLKEADVYRRVEHKNVMSILGQATEQEPYLVIMEQTPVGDLKKFLLEQRYDNNCQGIPHSLRMSIDIASGLHCLHANSFYHSDLAARNCLVFLDYSVKIGDYGISRSIYQSDYYNRPGAPNAVPIRWLPPEDVVIQQDTSLVTKLPSSRGNVWSFGVTLWEIIEGGRQPYEHLSDEEVLQSVVQDKLYHLPEPQKKGHVADLLYELMLQCWVEPGRRPPVEKLESALMSLMSRHSVPHVKPSAQSKAPRLDSTAAADTRAVTQPVAVVRPLRPESNDVTSSANNVHNKDVEITVIVSESPPPVTYIGDPSEDLDNTSTDVRSSPVQERLAGKSAAELVVVPGEIIRRRGSILRNPDAPSKPRKAVHFPVNILDLRTVHKYERFESYEEEDIEHEDEEQDTYAINIWSRDSPISSEESGEDLYTFPVERDIDSIDAICRDESKTVSNKEPSSPVEKKLKKATRRKKLEHCGKEWLATLEPETKDC